MLKFVISLFILINTVYFIPIKNLISAEVNFINVGQGDATLIRARNNTVLIDTGGLIYLDIANDTIIPYLKKKRIYDIDLLITTHDDFDHSGGVENLLKDFNVKKYIKEYDAFPISIGNISLYNYNNFIHDSLEENDNSLVIGFNLFNTSFLIMGDAPKEVENLIMEYYQNIDCDILKVGHHGSNTSTSDKFIKYLTPNEAIISCGKNNKFGHPHQEVINILKKNNVKIRRTDLEGTISYSSYFI